MSNYYKFLGAVSSASDWTSGVVLKSGETLVRGNVYELNNEELQQLKSLNLSFEKSSVEEQQRIQNEKAARQPRQAPADDTVGASPQFAIPEQNQRTSQKEV